MYSIEIYETVDGKSELWDFLEELRPGKNRILYFYFSNNVFILLHHFRKKTQKTPRSQIEKAKSEVIDYLKRKEK